MMRVLNVFAAISLVLMNGCGSVVQRVAELPTQALMVSTAAAPVGSGVEVRTVAFPVDIAFVSGRVDGEGGLGPGDRARPFTVPGIAANSDVYVAGYWGGSPNFNAIKIFVSEDSRNWSRAGSQFLIGTGQVGEDSRPSITFFPRTGTWFIAFRDASDGTIQVGQFRVNCARDGRGDCTTDSRGVSAFETVQVGSLTPTGIVTSRPPALSYLDNNLVIAFVPPLGTAINITTSIDGTNFSNPAVPLVNGNRIISDAGSPYLQNSVGTGFMSTARERAGGAVDVEIWRSASTDGMSWTPVRTLNAVGNTTFGRIDSAIAGPESEMVVAYRAHGLNETTVHVAGGSANIQNDTNRGVSLAYGPGPVKTGRFTCAEPNLVARGTTDVPVSHGRSVEVETNGDLLLLCGPSFQAAAGCANNTRRAIVSRSSGDGFTVACWRK